MSTVSSSPSIAGIAGIAGNAGIAGIENQIQNQNQAQQPAPPAPYRDSFEIRMDVPGAAPSVGKVQKPEEQNTLTTKDTKEHKGEEQNQSTTEGTEEKEEGQSDLPLMNTESTDQKERQGLTAD